MMNLEEAMEKILALQEEKRELEDQLTSFQLKVDEQTSKLESNASEISRLRELNMKYFTKLSIETEGTLGHSTENKDKEVEVDTTPQYPSIDDFMQNW